MEMSTENFLPPSDVYVRSFLYLLYTLIKLYYTHTHTHTHTKKTFCTGFTILDAIKNTCDSWEDVKISALKGVWKKLISTFMNDFEGFKTSVEDRASQVAQWLRVFLQCRRRGFDPWVRKIAWGRAW